MAEKKGVIWLIETKPSCTS